MVANFSVGSNHEMERKWRRVYCDNDYFSNPSLLRGIMKFFSETEMTNWIEEAGFKLSENECIIPKYEEHKFTFQYSLNKGTFKNVSYLTRHIVESIFNDDEYMLYFRGGIEAYPAENMFFFREIIKGLGYNIVSKTVTCIFSKPNGTPIPNHVDDTDFSCDQSLLYGILMLSIIYDYDLYILGKNTKLLTRVFDEYLFCSSNSNQILDKKIKALGS